MSPTRFGRSALARRAPSLVPFCAMTVPWPLTLLLGDAIMFLLGGYGLFLFASDRTATLPTIANRYLMTIGALIIGVTIMAASRTSLVPEATAISLLIKATAVVGTMILVLNAGESGVVGDRFARAFVMIGVGHVAAAIALLLAHQIGLPLPLTGRGFPLGVTEQFGFAGGKIPRAHGMFAEPADFAGFCAIALTIAVQRREQRTWVIRALVVGSVLSLSLTGFAIAVLGVALSPHRREFLPRLLGLGRLDALVTIPLTIIMLALISPALISPIENFVVGRSQAIADGGDQSAGGRISGSFETAAAGVSANPIIGSGYGYLGPVADRAGAFDSWTTVSSESGFNWNLTLFIAGSGGLVALLPWFGVLREAALGGREVFLPFLAWSSTTSNVAGGFLCVMLIWVATAAVRGRSDPDDRFDRHFSEVFV